MLIVLVVFVVFALAAVVYIARLRLSDVEVKYSKLREVAQPPPNEKKPPEITQTETPAVQSCNTEEIAAESCAPIPEPPEPVRPFLKDESEAAEQRRKTEIDAAISNLPSDSVVDVTDLISQLEKKQLEDEAVQWTLQEERRIQEQQMERDEALQKQVDNIRAEKGVGKEKAKEQTAKEEAAKEEAAKEEETKEEEAKEEETEEQRAERLLAYLEQVKERVFQVFSQDLKKRRKAECLSVFKEQQRELQKNKMAKQIKTGIETKQEGACNTQIKEENFDISTTEMKTDENVEITENTSSDFEDFEENETCRSECLEDLFNRTVWDLKEEEIENELEFITNENCNVGEFKMKGNQEFKEGKWEAASENYVKALLGCKREDLHAGIIRQLLGNLAAVKLSTKDYSGCVDDASDALEFDPVYIKALLRRFKAREALKSYHDALADINRAIELDPSLIREYGQAKLRIEKLSQEQFEREKEELMKQMKTFGNWALGKVGLSLDNFKLEQNPDTGAYNIQFVQKSNT